LDDKGETRRERNERAEVDCPDLVIPESGQHLFDLYFDISKAINRFRDGMCLRIDPVQFKAYIDLAQLRVTPPEFQCLIDMDTEFIGETQLELNSVSEKRREEIAKETKQRRRK